MGKGYCEICNDKAKETTDRAIRNPDAVYRPEHGMVLCDDHFFKKQDALATETWQAPQQAAAGGSRAVVWGDYTDMQTGRSHAIGGHAVQTAAGGSHAVEADLSFPKPPKHMCIPRPDLPRDWYEVAMSYWKVQIDEKRRQFFWFNVNTHATQWDKPTPLQLAAEWKAGKVPTSR